MWRPFSNVGLSSAKWELSSVMLMAVICNVVGKCLMWRLSSKMWQLSSVMGECSPMLRSIISNVGAYHDKCGEVHY